MLNYLVLRVCGIDIKPKYPFIGSAIRGVFGYSLKQACCPYVIGECQKCEFSNTCAYYEFFENINKTPKFKINIDLNQPTYDFEIFLFDSAINHLQKIIIALKNMSHIGFGVQKTPFKFEQILLNCRDITDQKLSSIMPSQINFTPKFTSGDYEFKTLTPLRIKQKNSYVKNTLDPSLLIRQMAMKFSELTGKKVAKFETSFTRCEQNFRFYDITRYSNRQECKMEFGGIVGSMKIYGLDECSAKLLELATLTNIGKSVTFGLGKVEIKQLEG